MFPLKHGGLALATSIASAVNVGMLWVILRKRIGKLLDRAFYLSVGKTAMASLVMVGTILVVGLIYPWNTSGPFNARLIHLVLCVACGGAAFFVAAFLFHSPEIATTVDAIRRRLTRGSSAA
jgi:putative peptidoglycan lipid II flippase